MRVIMMASLAYVTAVANPLSLPLRRELSGCSCHSKCTCTGLSDFMRCMQPCTGPSGSSSPLDECNHAKNQCSDDLSIDCTDTGDDVHWTCLNLTLTKAVDEAVDAIGNAIWYIYVLSICGGLLGLWAFYYFICYLMSFLYQCFCGGEETAEGTQTIVQHTNVHHHHNHSTMLPAQPAPPAAEMNEAALSALNMTTKTKELCNALGIDPALPLPQAVQSAHLLMKTTPQGSLFEQVDTLHSQVFSPSPRGRV